MLRDVEGGPANGTVKGTASAAARKTKRTSEIVIGGRGVRGSLHTSSSTSPKSWIVDRAGVAGMRAVVGRERARTGEPLVRDDRDRSRVLCSTTREPPIGRLPVIDPSDAQNAAEGFRSGTPTSAWDRACGRRRERSPARSTSPPVGLTGASLLARGTRTSAAGAHESASGHPDDTTGAALPGGSSTERATRWSRAAAAAVGTADRWRGARGPRAVRPTVCCQERRPAVDARGRTSQLSTSSMISVPSELCAVVGISDERRAGVGVIAKRGVTHRGAMHSSARRKLGRREEELASSNGRRRQSPRRIAAIIAHDAPRPPARLRHVHDRHGRWQRSVAPKLEPAPRRRTARDDVIARCSSRGRPRQGGAAAVGRGREAHAALPPVARAAGVGVARRAGAVERAAAAAGVVQHPAAPQRRAAGADARRSPGRGLPTAPPASRSARLAGRARPSGGGASAGHEPSALRRRRRLCGRRRRGTGGARRSQSRGRSRGWPGIVRARRASLRNCAKASRRRRRRRRRRSPTAYAPRARAAGGCRRGRRRRRARRRSGRPTPRSDARRQLARRRRRGRRRRRAKRARAARRSREGAIPALLPWKTAGGRRPRRRVAEGEALERRLREEFTRGGESGLLSTDDLATLGETILDLPRAVARLMAKRCLVMRAGSGAEQAADG